MGQFWATTTSFSGWKAQLATRPSEEAAFETWVFIQAASVLFEQKAGELLTLPFNQHQLSIEQRIACLDYLTDLWGVAYSIVHRNDLSCKVIIYRPSLVQARLQEVPCSILYDHLGYTDPSTAKAFLTELRHRWQEQGSIPHEIGVALGYPVKDVLGYMGLSELAFTAICGWRVYGDPTPSLMMSQACQQASRMAIWFVHTPQHVLGARDRAAA